MLILPTAIAAVFLTVYCIASFRVWYVQGQAPVYSQIPALKSARKTLLLATICLSVAALGEWMSLYVLHIEPSAPAPLVLDKGCEGDVSETCEEDLDYCQNMLLFGEKTMLTYDTHCQCPWSPLTLETLDTHEVLPPR